MKSIVPTTVPASIVPTTFRAARFLEAHRFPWIRERLGAQPSQSGAATAEYVIATMAAVGFAGLLVVIMRGDEVRGMLTDLVRNALTLVS